MPTPRVLQKPVTYTRLRPRSTRPTGSWGRLTRTFWGALSFKQLELRSTRERHRFLEHVCPSRLLWPAGSHSRYLACGPPGFPSPPQSCSPAFPVPGCLVPCSGVVRCAYFSEFLGPIATDASLALGAYCETEVDDSLAHSLWLNGDRRGGYSRLSVGATAVLRALGEECSEEVLGPPPGLESVPPSLPFVLDLIEIGHPLGPISAEAARIGLRVGPPIHREGSPHYDLLDPDFFVWFYAVLKEGRVLSVAIHPPSSPLSQLSRPTKGHSRTLRESRAVALAARCLLFFRCAVRLACPALVLTPALSSLCQWQSWKRTATTPQVLRLQLCLCAYGGRPGKVVSILAFGVHFGALARSCCCLATEHRVAVPCQGHLPTGLSAAIAEVFFTARRADLEKKSPRPALESVVVNDLLLTRPWRVRKVLKWKGSHHINVLELASLGALLRELASTSRDSRFSVFLDSAVAKAAAAKGRSTSYALAPGLARACSLQLAFGLYMSLGFAPTRLNIADDPTRCADLRPHSGTSLCDKLPAWALHGLGAKRFTRPIASWCRLFLLVLCAC